MRTTRSLAGTLVVAATLLGGCFSPDYQSGKVQCGADGSCPTGFTCAADRRCYAAGEAPDLSTSVVDLGAADLTGAPADLTEPPDLLIPADLTPVITSAPPASVYVCSGGGGATASSGRQLNLSLGGTIARGVGSASSGSSMSLGYFSSAAE
jgi:Cys-rich repeat protein